MLGTKTRSILGAAALAAFSSSAAHAEDPPPPKDAVEIRLAAPADSTMRFRRTTTAVTEAGGKTGKTEEESHVYSVRVRAQRPDGGLDVDVTIEDVRVKARGGRTGDGFDVDTSQPPPEGADPKKAMMDAITRAMTGRPFAVTLDAQGAPTAVSGFREVISAGLKGTVAEKVFPVKTVFTDDTCMKLVGTFFEAAPAGPRAAGAPWTGDASHEVSGQKLDFSVERKLASSTADDATVESKFTWKPSQPAATDGAQPEGGGTSVARFSRRDGLVIALTRSLEAHRGTADRRMTLRSETTIERLPAATPKAPEPPAKDPAPTEPPEKK